MPKGFRDTGGYVVGYWAQVLAYLLLVTDRYPNADPTAMLRPPSSGLPVHPVHVVGDPRICGCRGVTVFFRLPLALPLLFWLMFWGVLAFVAAICSGSSRSSAARPRVLSIASSRPTSATGST